MAYDNLKQSQSIDVRRAQSPYPLALKSVPATVDLAFLGKSLHDVGALNVAGAYVCEFFTDDWTVVEALLKPSAVTGTFAPTLQVITYVGDAHPVKTTAGSNFVAATAQVLSLSALNGYGVCQVIFTVPGGGSITFARASNALAEFSGL